MIANGPKQTRRKQPVGVLPMITACTLVLHVPTTATRPAAPSPAHANIAHGRVKDQLLGAVESCKRLSYMHTTTPCMLEAVDITRTTSDPAGASVLGSHTAARSGPH